MTIPVSRRQFLTLAGVAASSAALAACGAAPTPPVYVAATPTLRGPGKVDSATALTRLTEGNARYITSQRQYPDLSVERRVQVAQSQPPFAAILCCADARVPPEVIFDQGLGDLFVVRVAGNVLDDPIIGSLEYAVEHLGVSLIMVLGHTRCDVVRAAVESVYFGTEAPPHIDRLVQALEPAVKAAEVQPGDPWLNAINVNIQQVTAALLAAPPILSQAAKAKELQVVGALYDLESGWVQTVAPQKGK